MLRDVSFPWLNPCIKVTYPYGMIRFSPSTTGIVDDDRGSGIVGFAHHDDFCFNGCGANNIW